MARPGAGKRKMQSVRKKQSKATSKAVSKDMKLIGGMAKGIGQIMFAPAIVAAEVAKKSRKKKKKR